MLFRLWVSKRSSPAVQTPTTGSVILPPILQLPDDVLESIADHIWAQPLVPALYSASGGFRSQKRDVHSLRYLAVTCRRFRPPCQRHLLARVRTVCNEHEMSRLERNTNLRAYIQHFEPTIGGERASDIQAQTPQLVRLVSSWSHLRSITFGCSMVEGSRRALMLSFAAVLELLPCPELALQGFRPPYMPLAPQHRRLDSLVLNMQGSSLRPNEPLPPPFWRPPQIQKLCIQHVHYTRPEYMDPVDFRARWNRAIRYTLQQASAGKPSELHLEKWSLPLPVLQDLLYSLGSFGERIEILGLDCVQHLAYERDEPQQLTRTSADVKAGDLSLAPFPHLREVRVGCMAGVRRLVCLPVSVETIRMLWLNASHQIVSATLGAHALIVRETRPLVKVSFPPAYTPFRIAFADNCTRVTNDGQKLELLETASTWAASLAYYAHLDSEYLRQAIKEAVPPLQCAATTRRADEWSPGCYCGNRTDGMAMCDGCAAFYAQAESAKKRTWEVYLRTPEGQEWLEFGGKEKQRRLDQQKKKWWRSLAAS